MNLQDCINLIQNVISTTGPVPARSIESHPEVVRACRATKTKARNHINKLLQLGQIKSNQQQQALYWK